MNWRGLGPLCFALSALHNCVPVATINTLVLGCTMGCMFVDPWLALPTSPTRQLVMLL